MSAALTEPQRAGIVAALAQLCAARLAAWSPVLAEAHAWAARALIEAAGAEGERPAWHVKHGRIDQARAELRALLAMAEAAHG